MLNGWTQREGEQDTWDRRIDDEVRCYVSKYHNSDHYNWQAIRGNHRLSNMVYRDRESAMRAADDAIALPVDEFNARVVADLLDDLRKIERDIMRLAPTTELIPGYHAGYENGVADTRRKILAAIDPDTSPEEPR